MTAPPFSLSGYYNGEIVDVALEELLEDGPVLIGTYPFDFTDVCRGMMCQLRDMDWYRYKRNLSLVGISRDSPFAHEKFAEQENLSFPLLSDIDGEMLRAYGLLAPKVRGIPNVPHRAILLIALDGTIRYRWVANDPEGEWTSTPVEEAIRVLKDL